MPTTTLKSASAIAFILLFNNAFSFSEGKKKHNPISDTAVCLEVSGNLTSEVKNTEGTYVVKLLQNNQVIEQVLVDSKQKFKLHLKRNNLYTIKIEKEGFLPRLVSISTQMPTTAKKSNLYRFHFDIELFAEAFSKYFDQDDIDFPIALISYNTVKGVFNYDKNYTIKIQEKMHSMSSTAR